MRVRQLAGVATLVLLATIPLGGCTQAGGDADTLTVLAASSLTETFTELADTFEDEHPGVEVRLAFDSSATLATQVLEGAPADVLATADEQTMESVVAAGATTERAVFASNRLVLVVPAANPADVRSVDDLDRDDVAYVACVPSAPCGRVAAAALAEAGVRAAPASEESDVKAVLSKVVLDEADAGLVYASDALAAGDSVRVLEVSTSASASTRYVLAALADAPQPELARQWVDLVQSERGRRVLRDAGFGPP